MTAKLTVIEHPLVRHKISLLRDQQTKSIVFRALVREIAQLMTYEVTRDLALVDRDIETPVALMTAQVLAHPAPVLVSILRAGNTMLDGVLDLLPTASVAHIGMYRDHETLKAVEYSFNGPPDIADRLNLVVDPMLATANSGIAAIARLKDKGVRDLRMMSILAAPEGLAAFAVAHPDVPVVVGEVDERLNEKGYIVPGLGDAGDRSYGT
ncbi:MAG: uracil phosphoribosyltransferase [Alphaproteobacteria bacterium]|jgi:uracil phosphoribosyltransferase|nr:uracil phosphoribosyltransferase [Alphaproteobacteria bacterium]